MRVMEGRCLPVWLFMLILLAASAHAQQPTSGASLPGDPFAGEDLQAPAPAGGRGDPFASGLNGDPFADEPAFESDPDNGADHRNPDDASERLLRFDLHGYLESRNRLRTGADRKVISARQRLWVESDGALFPGREAGDPLQVRFFASAALDVDPAAARLSDDHEPVRFHPEEVFLTLDTANLDVILGRKMLRWGTGDGINPLDLINPVDHRDPIASGRADTRVPVLLGQTIVRLPSIGPLQETTLEGVVIPLARVNELNAAGSAWESRGLRELREAEARGLLLLESQEEPDEFVEDAEFGARLAVTFSGWDLALIGYYGHIDSPVFSRDLVAVSGGGEVPRLTPIHPTFYAYGINFAKGLDRSTFRGELSVKPDLPVMLADPSAMPGYARRSVVEGVVGVDRTFGTNLYTNFQYFCTFIEDARDLVRDRYDHGMTYEIHDLFLQDDLEAGIRGIISFSDQGWTCEPYAELSLGDDWLLAASLLFFEGPENGRFGQFTANDMLTIRLRYSF
jgi:hypothetical protein